MQTDQRHDVVTVVNSYWVNGPFYNWTRQCLWDIRQGLSERELCRLQATSLKKKLLRIEWATPNWCTWHLDVWCWCRCKDQKGPCRMCNKFVCPKLFNRDKPHRFPSPVFKECLAAHWTWWLFLGMWKCTETASSGFSGDAPVVYKRIQLCLRIKTSKRVVGIQWLHSSRRVLRNPGWTPGWMQISTSWPTSQELTGLDR